MSDLGATGAPAHHGSPLRAPLTERSRRARSSISSALVLADVALLVMIVAGLHGPVRFIVGLLVALTVPGWAIIGLLRLSSPALEAGLTMAVSLSLLMIAAQLLITIHQWHLTGLQVAVCVLCLPSLVWQALDGRGPRRDAP